MDYKEFLLRNKDKYLKTLSNGVYYEQKITPDLMTFASECILNLEKIKNDDNSEFTSNDIRDSNFYKDEIEDIYTKPEDSEDTENEYNKLIKYQLDVLSFIGVLERNEGKRPFSYKIKEKDIINSLVDIKFSTNFLYEYIILFLNINKYNGVSLLSVFEEYKNLYEEFKEESTLISKLQKKYEEIKLLFFKWAKLVTNVKGDDPKHTWRVFNKIFNIYTYKNSLPGQVKARVKPGKFQYSNLLYNRVNFRDLGKSKDETRASFDKRTADESRLHGYIDKLIKEAVTYISKRHICSEIDNTNNEGIHIHHIFPKYEFMELSYYKENLIALTPGQHYSYAHEKGNTQKINMKYQILCLISKLNSIEQSINTGDGFYNIKKFIEMLNVGLNYKFTDDVSIKDIRKELELRYSSF